MINLIPTWKLRLDLASYLLKWKTTFLPYFQLIKGHLESEWKIYCHVLVTTHGVWSGKWIYWTLVTCNYSNYNALTNSHTILLTTGYAKSSQCVVFTSRCRETDPNSVLFCSCWCWASTISQLTTNSWWWLAVYLPYGFVI
jgi:hypothetical protein